MIWISIKQTQAEDVLEQSEALLQNKLESSDTTLITTNDLQHEEFLTLLDEPCSPLSGETSLHILAQDPEAVTQELKFSGWEQINSANVMAPDATGNMVHVDIYQNTNGEETLTQFVQQADFIV